jgi:hypothetical protein
MTHTVNFLRDFDATQHGSIKTKGPDDAEA